MIKQFVRYIAYHTGLIPLWHRVRNRSCLTVLMFHRVLPDDSPALAQSEREYALSETAFAACLSFIKKHYNVVELSALLESRELPACPMLITFDDGWHDTLESAVPILRSFNLPATVFVVPEVVRDMRTRWWADALVEALTDSDRCQKIMSALGMSDFDPQLMHAKLAKMSVQDRWATLNMSPDSCDGLRQMMDETALNSLDQHALTLGAHGFSHAPLTLVSDARDEIARSCAWLMDHQLGCRSMAFPHGAWSPSLAQIALDTGFELVFNSVPALTKIIRRQGAQVPWNRAIGRIHVPENEWTCENGSISAPKLASFLFMRPVQ